MNGELSQLVTLTSAANGFLLGCDGSASVYPSNASFRFCNTVHFVDLKKGPLRKPRDVERHKDPGEWLLSLKSANANRAWLMYHSTPSPVAPDHQLAAFVGGGGQWQLVVSYAKATEVWLPRWEVSNRDAPDKRIWRVSYACVANLRPPSTVPEPRLGAAASRLLASLNAAREFATLHDLPFWADRFQRAAGSLDPSKPVVFPDYIEFVCLDWYCETARRLFAAAYNGWVFGGMGSWNDLYFQPDSENARYTTISKELYSAITDAIQQATWSFGQTHAA
jgi:hypothetical protein